MPKKTLKTPPDLTNKFFDINKLPSEWGIVLLPISMSRIANAQSAEACLEYIHTSITPKIQSPTVGLHFIYADSLYLDNDLTEDKTLDPHKKRMNYMQEVEKHRFGMIKLIEKFRTTEFQIPSAFEFMSWNQVIINAKNFATRLKQLHKIYDKDELFQQYLKEDTLYIGRQYNEAQINFFLEEHLLCYLATCGEITFSKRHVQDRQQWILWCYPGKPPKALVYLYQLNPFQLQLQENKFSSAQYNLVEKKLYDAKNIDLSNYSLEEI